VPQQNDIREGYREVGAEFGCIVGHQRDRIREGFPQSGEELPAGAGAVD
jgi:hypothetical protein